MNDSTTPAVEHFYYRAVAPSSRHRSRVSAYLVHRFTGSVVVARIEPLGLVPSALGEHSATLAGLRRNLRVVGAWQRTPTSRHRRVRLMAREEPVTARRPTESR